MTWLLNCFASFICCTILTVTLAVTEEDTTPLSAQVKIDGGKFWMGSQLAIGSGKLMPGNHNLEGAKPRKRAYVRPFEMDVDCVTNRQFARFVRETGYQTDSEKYGWSFVLEALLAEAELAELVEQTDNPEHGFGRVKTSLHWLGVHGANWFHPYGQMVVYTTYPKKDGSTTAEGRPKMVNKGKKTLERERARADKYNAGISVDALGLWDYPVVHVSYNDATAFCDWSNSAAAADSDSISVEVDADSSSTMNTNSDTVRRLPTEAEWEFAARSGRFNESYPWGDSYKTGRMNIWDSLPPPKGSKEPKYQFPHIHSNTRADGHLGVAPVGSYPPSDFGLHNMLGNVWEWVAGGDDKERILRGGSFVDSADGAFNHIVLVSTRQFNSADSGASNVGFRCAKGRRIAKL